MIPDLNLQPRSSRKPRLWKLKNFHLDSFFPRTNASYSIVPITGYPCVYTQASKSILFHSDHSNRIVQSYTPNDNEHAADVEQCEISRVSISTNLANPWRLTFKISWLAGARVYQLISDFRKDDVRARVAAGCAFQCVPFQLIGGLLHVVNWPPMIDRRVKNTSPILDKQPRLNSSDSSSR